MTSLRTICHNVIYFRDTLIIWDLVGFYKVFIILFMFSVQYKFYISSMWQKANYRIDPANSRQIYNQPQQIFTHFLFPHNKLSQVTHSVSVVNPTPHGHWSVPSFFGQKSKRQMKLIIAKKLTKKDK